jgi:hypothetical protein
MIARALVSRREIAALQYPDCAYTTLPPGQIAPNGQGLQLVAVETTSSSKYVPLGHNMQALNEAVKFDACIVYPDGHAIKLYSPDIPRFQVPTTVSAGFMQYKLVCVSPTFMLSAVNSPKAQLLSLLQTAP